MPLHFDLDEREISELLDAAGLNERQAKFALGRALNRTAATLRQRSAKGLKSELDIKRMAYLRRRLKSVKLRLSSGQGVRLWYGLNDMPVSTLRGSIQSTSDGASFSGKAGQETFKGAFINRGRYGRTIVKRRGAARLPIEEAAMPVKDRMDIFVEDQVFDQIDEIFWKHFERDVRARARGFGRSA